MSENNKNIEMTAGEMLVNARTNGRRKRELATIARQLCIKEEFLDAIERGDYREIPEMVYILGFARNYALEVGVDPDIIVKKIKKETGLIHEEEANLSADADKAEEVAKAPVAKPVSREKKKSGRPSRALKNTAQVLHKHWKWLVGAVVLIAIVIVVAVLAISSDRAEVPADIVPQVETPVMVEPAYTIPVKEVFGMATPTTQIILQATGETWLKVEDTKGETLFSRVLTAGDVYYVPSGGAIATVGNAGGLDVWVDGRPAPKLGGRGVKRSDIRLTPDVLMTE